MKSIGIDLGTANSRIFVKGKGIILREPSAVAVSETTEEVLAVGLDASRMAGKTPDDVSVRRPIKSGVIAQFDAAVAMVDVFLQKAGTSLSGGRYRRRYNGNCRHEPRRNRRCTFCPHCRRYA